MDSSNWRTNQGTNPTMDTSDWRAQLPPEARQRIVNKIMDTLKKHLPVSGPDGLHELQKIAQRFEDKIFTAAISQPDYLRKISLKMLTMETKSQNTLGSNMPPNQVGPSNEPPDQGLVLQPQVQNHGQQHSIPLPNQLQPHQQLLSQNIETNVASQPNLAPVSSLSLTPSQNIVQNSNIQNIPGPNSVGSTISQNSNLQNMFAGSQRQMPGRQQIAPPQQQLQAQNQQQYLYQQQLLKQKLHLQSLMLLQQQQQHNLLQRNQLQSSQQSVMQTSSVMQPSMMQTPSLSSLPQNQQSTNVQQSTQSMQQQHSQVIRHQQQAPLTQQQQQLMGPQSNTTNMQHTQMLGQQNNVGDIQQLQRMLSQQNNLANMQQLINQQNVLDQQKQLYQSQRTLAETSATSLDSTTQTAQPSGVDCQEVYQKFHPQNYAATQQTNINSLLSQGGANMIQPNALWSGSSELQHLLKLQQEQQMLQSQQFKQQYQQQQQLLQRQLLQQQQQLHYPAKPQLSAQFQTHQMPQLHKMNDINDIKMQPGMGVKPGVFQQHLASGQHSTYSHQQLKQGSAFPVSSPLLLQVTSPQVQQHSSPQFEQQNHLPFKTKLGTPLQYSNSPFVGPTPSPPLSPSPMPGEFEKSIPCVSSISNAANIGHQQTRVAVAPAQSLAIGILGISASPLLTEFSDPDGVHGNALAATSGKSTVTVQPVEHLINVEKSMSPRTDHCRKTYTKSFIFLSLFVIMTIIGGTFLYNGIEKFQATARDVSDVLVSRANTVADVIHKVLVDLEAANNVKGCINSL